jgi:hypothetical protein
MAFPHAYGESDSLSQGGHERIRIIPCAGYNNRQFDFQGVKMSFQRSLILSVSLMAAMAACADLTLQPANQECTLIGCNDQLSVKLVPALSLPYGALITSGSQTTKFTCTPQGVRDEEGPLVILDCWGEGFSIEPPAGEIKFSAFGDGATRSTTVTPAYDEVRPNGPDCAPVCRQGSVTLEPNG